MMSTALSGKLQVSFAAVVLGAVASSCTARATAPPPRHATINVPAPGLHAPTAAERIEAALASREHARAPRVEVTAAPQTVLPRPAKSALAQAPSTKGVIVLHDEAVVRRVLTLPDVELRRLESSALARLLLRECFGAATSPENVVSDLGLNGSRVMVESADVARSPNAACVRRVIAGRVEPSGSTDVRLRITVRFLPGFDGAPSDAPPATSTSVDEEIEELARMIKGTEAPERRRELVPLLGARRLDAARLAQGNARDAQLASARAAFEEALLRAGSDAPARAAALHGLFLSLTMLGKLDEATRAARALACPSRYPSPAAPLALEQDHPLAWWEQWERMHPTPIGMGKAAARRWATTSVSATGPRTWEEETSYRSPYEGCAAPADVPARWVLDAWRSIAAYHAEQDLGAGPFHDNRAATALRFALPLALASSSGEAAFVSLDLGRVLVHQQRYGDAVRVLGRIAFPPDDRELMERAAQLVGTSLTYLDLEGPRESEPMVERADVVDLEPNPAVAERKLAPIVERTARAELVPQNETFTPLVIHWMSWELGAIYMNHTAVDLEEQFLTRYPNHRDAPLVQWEQADTYAMMANYFRPNAPEAVEPRRLAAEARARLARYAGSTPWTDANRNDDEALQRASDLARAKPKP